MGNVILQKHAAIEDVCVIKVHLLKYCHCYTTFILFPSVHSVLLSFHFLFFHSWHPPPLFFLFFLFYLFFLHFLLSFFLSFFSFSLFLQLSSIPSLPSDLSFLLSFSYLLLSLLIPPFTLCSVTHPFLLPACFFPSCLLAFPRIVHASHSELFL